jgi:predicted metal-dependent peptidase
MNFDEWFADRTSPAKRFEKRSHLLVLEHARLTIRVKWPFMTSALYALTPVPREDIPTSCLTPGMVLGYNPTFFSWLTNEEAAFVLLHEIFHYRLKFFEMLAIIGPDLMQVVNEAQDMVINVMLREGGWPVFSWASVPEKYSFPRGLSTKEYVDLLLQQQPPPPKGGGGGKPGGQTGRAGGGGTGPTDPEAQKKKPTCGGGCTAPSKEIEKELDASAGRGQAEVAAVERKTANDIKDHIQKQGRGSLPAWLAEWAEALEEESTLDWRQLLYSIVLNAHGRAVTGGDDFSMRHPSKRSYVRRLIRPGLVDHEVVVLFIMDTSGSMNVPMMMDGVKESVAILRQLGIEEAYYMEVDANVALEPRLVDLSFFEQPIEFHGRGGTDFRPAFKAIEKMPRQPDIAFYWTDGDGWAPVSPPPNVEVIWGLVPGRYHTRRPASWGHLVVLDEDPSKQQFFADAPTWENEVPDEEEEDAAEEDD